MSTGEGWLMTRKAS